MVFLDVVSAADSIAAAILLIWATFIPIPDGYDNDAAAAVAKTRVARFNRIACALVVVASLAAVAKLFPPNTPGSPHVIQAETANRPSAMPS